MPHLGQAKSFNAVCAAGALVALMDLWPNAFCLAGPLFSSFERDLVGMSRTFSVATQFQVPAAAKDGFGWLNIRIIRIRIRLKCKYGYPYSYLILIWMSYGCIRIRFWELFSIRFHIRIRGISDNIRIRSYSQRKSD